MNMTEINAEGAPNPVGSYPHAKRVGPWLFISGVGPRKAGQSDIPGVTLNAQGGIVQYDVAKQSHSVFHNISEILRSAGSDWQHIVDITVFLTNMKQDFATFNEIYQSYFPDNRPARTTVEVNALPTPIAVELKCIALVKDA